MAHYAKIDTEQRLTNSTKILRSVPDIDQLCNLIDESTFGLQSFSLPKFRSIPASQVKAFRSSRLKRLHTKVHFSENENPPLPTSTLMRLSLPSSLLSQFRSLSTNNLPKSRRYSTSAITFLRAKSVLPSTNEEQLKSSAPTQSQLSCTLVDTRRAAASSCNVEELAAYMDDFLYLPKSLSGAAELMYT